MAVSSDGILTVLPAKYAGVGVDVDWGAAAGVNPWRTTVKRTVSGSTVTVRSGDLAYSPGGVVHVRDNEAPLEGSLTFQAWGYDALGALVRTSTTATLVLPQASGVAWLKCIGNPSLSRQVSVSRFEDESWDVRDEVFTVPGRSNPVIYEDAQGGLSGTLGLLTATRSDWLAIEVLAASGVLLLQASSTDYAIPRDLYLKRRNLGASRPGRLPGWSLREFTLPFTEVDRPSTTDSPLLIPGWSWDIAASTYSTWTAFDGAFASNISQSKGP